MKTCAVFLTLVALMAILSCIYSLPTSSIIIGNTGLISANNTINATSGSPTDIQTAVNTAISYSAAKGGNATVYIPAGDWRCDEQPFQSYGTGGAISIDLETLPSGAWLNIIGSYVNTTTTTQNGITLANVPSTILRSYTDDNGNLTVGIGMFGVVGSNAGSSNMNNTKSANRHIRISGLTILGYTTNDGTVSSHGSSGIAMEFVDGYLIDHVAIDSHTSGGISSSYSKGVISNCIITQYYHKVIGGVWGYGVGIYGNFGYYANGLGSPTWIQNVSQVIGKYDWQGITLNYTIPVNGDLTVKGTTSSISFTAGPVYIEYSQFNMTRHCVASSSYAYYVFRYNTVFGGVGLHAIDQHGGGWSGAANAYATRGTEVYNNTVDGNPAGGGVGTATYSFGLRGGASLIFNNTFKNTYTGIALTNENYNSSDPNDVEYINDVWIWNNTFNNVITNLSVNSGQGITASVNYFSDIPSPTTPAPPKPGYVPYAFPHPLTLATP